MTLFTSDIIPDWMNAEIVAAQAAVGPDAAFSFLKQVPLSVRMKAEREIKRKVQKILESYKRRAAQAVRRGEEFDYSGMADKLRAAVLPELRKLTVDNALRLSVETGVSFDPAIINQEALRWAREFSDQWASGITNTTRNQLREAVSAFVQTPGMTLGDVQSLIEPAFGAVRADMIASTEVTRAYAQATNNIESLLQQEAPGLTTTQVWNTLQDEQVCPICGPLEGAPKERYQEQFPEGPPAHPRCRCSTSIRFDEPETLAAEFEERQDAREAWLREAGLWKEPPIQDEISGFSQQQQNAMRSARATFKKMYNGPASNLPFVQSREELSAVAKYMGNRIEVNPAFFNDRALDQGVDFERVARQQRRIEVLKQELTDWGEGMPDARRTEIDRLINFIGEQIEEETTSVVFTAPESIEELIIHEYGHAIEGDLQVGVRPDITDFLPPSQQEGRWSESLMHRIDLYRIEHGREISEYAATDGLEYFAEAFVRYKQGRTEAIYPDLLELFEEVTR